MFSQWAAKRVCKFFMRRLFERILRSELDLEQLEVQLGFGTIQLKDLMLNTDYLNDQLGDAPLAIKEGSIGSVRAKIPWKVLTAEPCEIEVDELKLVIVPRAQNFGSNVTGPDGDDLHVIDAPYPLGDADNAGLGSAGGGVYIGVEDGVRMIAKMVERVLLGLRVRITNLVVVFEEQTETRSSDPSKSTDMRAPRCILMAQIGHVEYGVEAPFDDVEEVLKSASGLEPSMLVKVVKFRDATMGILEVQDAILNPGRLGGRPAVVPHGHLLREPLSVLAGQNGGLEGSVQLSVPWKGGVVDVPKVHADIVVGFIILRLSLRQIQQLLSLTQAFASEGRSGLNRHSLSVPLFKSSHEVNRGNIAEGGFLTATGPEKNNEVLKTLFGSVPSTNRKDIELDSSRTEFLPVTRFISDWMQGAGNEGERKDGALAESDLAASVDEFFDCFDGSRSSQSTGGSGMWNWTRSAFRDITTASSLAAGSVIRPEDSPRQPEYSLNARLGGISVELNYDFKSTEVCSLAPSLATGTHLSKGVTTKDASDAGRETLQETTSVADASEGFLKAELCNLNISLAVSGSLTELNAAVKSLDLSELVPKDFAEYAGSREWSSRQPDAGPFVPVTQLLQSSIESILPVFPASLVPCAARSDSQRKPFDVSGTSAAEQDGQGSRSWDKVEHVGKYDRKQLARVSSESNDAAQVAVTWQSYSRGNDHSCETEMTASLQPLVIWLDLHTLKRVISLMEKSVKSLDERLPVQDRDQSSSSSAGPELPFAGNSLEPAVSVDKHVKENAAGSGSFKVKLFAPRVRVLIHCPLQGGLGSSALRDDFISLEVNAPVSQLGTLQPILNFRHLGETRTVPLDTSEDTLSLTTGDIVVQLILRVNQQHKGENADKCDAYTVDEILRVRQCESQWGSSPTPDRQLGQGASVEFHWSCGAETGTCIAKRAWDGVAAQERQGDGRHGTDGTNSEFAAATTAIEALDEENALLREEMLASSSSVVRIIIPWIKISLAEPHYTRGLKLIGCVMDTLLVLKDEDNGAEKNFAERGLPQGERMTDAPELGSKISQAAILVQCGHMDVVLYLPAQGPLSADPKLGLKVWDVVCLNLTKLQLLSVVGIDRRTDASYLWVHHEESEITGSFLSDDAGIPYQNTRLVSCKSEVLGRGNGGGGNAVAGGKAGFTVTYIVWPGQEKLGDAMLTGTIRGLTVIADSGRLDWLSVVYQFLAFDDDAGRSEERSVRAVLDNTVKVESHHTSAVSPATIRTYFLLDFHDVALCYEPGSEAMLVPSIRAGRNPVGPGTSVSAEASQIVEPVACVAAAAGVRISSSTNPSTACDQYDIWLRDIALHLLDTTLQKRAAFDYSTESMQLAGYVQIAKDAVMEALVRVHGDNGLLWELECANNQLQFDTCHDTTAAFGRLVAQLQQLFAPEVEAQNDNANPWKGDKRSSGGESPSSSTKIGVTSARQNGADQEEGSSINLFEGVLEDAFSRARSSISSGVGDDDVSDLQGDTYAVVDSSHSGVCSMDRHGSFDHQQSGPANRSGPSTPKREQPWPTSRTASDGSFMITNNGLPTFIEDYHVTVPSVGMVFPTQTEDTPGQSAGSSRHASRESINSGSVREAEGKGGWYSSTGIEVLEDHVPEQPFRMSGTQRNSSSKHQSDCQIRDPTLPKKYPSSVGRVILRNLSVKWRIYDGSDWVGQVQRVPSSVHESGRKLGSCLEVILDGMDLQYDTFPAIGLYSSRLVVSIQDIGVYDCSNDAPWRMVLGYHWSKSRPRESSSQAVNIEMDAVRPDPLAPLEEFRLYIELLPIRLHLDQRHIDFCIEFFSSRVPPGPGRACAEEGGCPFVGVSVPFDLEIPSDTSDSMDEALLPYFQIFEIKPVTVCVDYIPRHVDLTSLGGGNYVELLNFVTWKGIELNLKHVRVTGVHGWGSLSEIMFGEWLEEISQNQVHKIVQGVGPIRPLYAVGSGAAKLVVLPAEHYKKDRRLFRGMRKGAIAFFRSISLEALGLGAHLASGMQEILQQTELALGGSPNAITFKPEKGDRRRAVQPGDTREGLQQACESISQGLERTASSIVGNPLKVYRRGAGASLAVTSALRAAPAATVAPASAALGAVHRALLGVRNGLAPEKKRESDEKHTGPPTGTRRAHRPDSI